MDKKEFLGKFKSALDEIIESTPYDMFSFDSREDEAKYISKKTSNFDITKQLLKDSGEDGIIVITKDSYYAISPISIHDDAFVKLFNHINEENKHFKNTRPIEYYVDKGSVLIRVVNNRGIVGFDSYMPEELNDYQIRMLDNIARELNGVYKEIAEFDDMNASNIKYGIDTIRGSVKTKKL